MADFKTHITVSTAIGVAYGGVAYAYFQPYFNFEHPATTCLLAGTLCSVSGMLPDLDSDSGVPLRESLTFASACIPMLLLDRFQHQWNLPPEQIAMAGAAVYAAVRFGLGWLLKKYTVHRGMFHSIPAAAIAGAIAFLLCSHGNEYVRAYKAMAVVIGFMSHLVLDEIWSVKVQGGRIGLKSSSGTALKLWGSSMWANISTYAKLALLSVLVLKDPMWTNVSPELAKLHDAATKVGQDVQLPDALANLPQALQGNDPLATAGAAPQGYSGGVYAPQGTYVPEGLYAPRQYAPQPVSRPGYGQPAYGPAGYAPGYAPSGYGAQPSFQPPGYQGGPPGYPIPMGVGPGPSQPRY